MRELTAANGTVLIFDEVITGFRLGLGGAQQRYGVAPDLTVLGKALGAGLPISAVYRQRGHARAHRVRRGVAARHVQRQSPVGRRGRRVPRPSCGSMRASSIRAWSATRRRSPTTCARPRGAWVSAVTANRVGPCVQLFAGADAVPTLADLARVDKEPTLDLTALLVQRGVAPLPRGMMYLSTAHTDHDIDYVTLAAR